MGRKYITGLLLILAVIQLKALSGSGTPETPSDTLPN